MTPALRRRRSLPPRQARACFAAIGLARFAIAGVMPMATLASRAPSQAGKRLATAAVAMTVAAGRLLRQEGALTLTGLYQARCRRATRACRPGRRAASSVTERPSLRSPHVAPSPRDHPVRKLRSSGTQLVNPAYDGSRPHRRSQTPPEINVRVFRNVRGFWDDRVRMDADTASWREIAEWSGVMVAVSEEMVG